MLRRSALFAAALTAALLPAAASGAAPTITPLFDTAAPEGLYLAAAGGGELVAIRRTSDGRSSLFTHRVGEAPRFLRSFRDLGRVTVGTDARGRAVAVAVSCAHLCNLVTVDLQTGKALRVRRTTNARLGVMSRGRVTFVRESLEIGYDLLVELSAAGGSGRVTDTRLLARADHNYDGERGDVEVDALAVHGTNLAVTLQYDTVSNGGSSVNLRRGRGPWTLLARSGYGEASGIARVFTGLSLDSRGVRSFYDGGDNDRPFVARWRLDGRLVKRVMTPDTYTQVNNPAIDGDALYLNEARSLACDNEATGCAPIRFAPLGLG